MTHPDRCCFFRILLALALLFGGAATALGQQQRTDTELKTLRSAVPARTAAKNTPVHVRPAPTLPVVRKDSPVSRPSRTGGQTAAPVNRPASKKDSASTFSSKSSSKSSSSSLPSVRTGTAGGAGALAAGERDSAAVAADTVPRQIVLPGFAGLPLDVRSLGQYVMGHNAIFTGAAEPLRDMAIPRMWDTREGSEPSLFYIILGVLFLLGVIRLSFAKYFSDLFRAFFNPTLSQRQLRDQLSQTPFPALLLNIFFTLSAGLYLFLILRHFDYVTTARPLYLIPVFMVLIMAIYLVKYLFIRFGGWLFGYQDASDGYIFTLYMINKVLGVALWPFILMLAFSPPALASAALDVSLIMILLLLAYRYIRAFTLVRSQIFLNKFHFFIYLCGFEIAPVLIIGKLVLIWLNGA
jgi:hypothetical protein